MPLEEAVKIGIDNASVRGSTKEGFRVSEKNGGTTIPESGGERDGGKIGSVPLV